MGRFFSAERGGCMGISLSDEIRQLLDRPNFAHLATLMPDGSPQSVPVWLGREGDRILICTGGSLPQSEEHSTRSASRTLPRRFPQPVSGGPASWPRVERRPDNDFQYLDAISPEYT